MKHLIRNHRLFLKYLYFNLPHLYLNQHKKGFHNTSIIIPKVLLYYTSIHLRFGSLYYLTQLVDLFAYEIPVTSTVNQHSRFPIPSYQTKPYCLVYNFHNLLFQDRLFFFCADSRGPLNSISEIFPNAGWLEREVSELHGVVFTNKKDLRNLMLQYGDTTVPFQKAAPSIGYKEVFYDSVTDVLVETPITLQV